VEKKWKLILDILFLCMISSLVLIMGIGMMITRKLFIDYFGGLEEYSIITLLVLFLMGLVRSCVICVQVFWSFLKGEENGEKSD